MTRIFRNGELNSGTDRLADHRAHLRLLARGPDTQRQACRNHGHHTTRQESIIILARPDTDRSSTRCRQSGSKLMKKKDPSIDATNGAFAKGIRRYGNYGRHRGKPVQPIDHGKNREASKIIDKRQDKERKTTQRKDKRKPLFWSHSVDHPPGKRRANEVEPSHDPNGCGRGNFWYPTVDRMGNRCVPTSPLA